MGYMGAGKSTIGRVLATLIGVPHYDLDQEIASKEGKTVQEIFESKGEIYFRRIESAMLKTLLEENSQGVFSLGGGTPAYGNNLQLINQPSNKSIYLKGNLPTLLQNLKGEIQQRPLLQDKSEEQLQEYVAKHLFERQAYYQQAHQIIRIDGKTPAEIAEEIRVGLA